MALRMDDGTERECGPGETFHMPPGHDAWIVGDEACVLLDFEGPEGIRASKLKPVSEPEWEATVRRAP